MTATPVKRVAYLLKVYPRFSQTFVLNEIIAHQKAIEPVAIFSLRRSDDARFHESLALVESPVHYINTPKNSASNLWRLLSDAHRCGFDFQSLLNAEEDIAMNDLEQALLLAAAIREQKIDHLHAHFATVATTVARMAAKLAGITYSFTAHAKDIFHESVNREVLHRKITDASAVITVSQFNVDHLEAEFGDDVNNIQLIYNGVEPNDFPFSLPIKRPPFILGVGRLVEKKGFNYLIEACAILREQGSPFCCEIAGSGVLEDELRTKIYQLGLESHIKLVGPLPRAEIRRKLREACVLAAPCVVAQDGDKDGLPTILIEAMALGTPCISTDVTGIPEILQNDVTGLCVPQRNSISLANACRRLITDGYLRVRLAGHARKLVENRFDINRNSKQLRHVFFESKQERSAEQQVRQIQSAISG